MSSNSSSIIAGGNSRDCGKHSHQSTKTREGHKDPSSYPSRTEALGSAKKANDAASRSRDGSGRRSSPVSSSSALVTKPTSGGGIDKLQRQFESRSGLSLPRMVALADDQIDPVEFLAAPRELLRKMTALRQVDFSAVSLIAEDEKGAKPYAPVTTDRGAALLSALSSFACLPGLRSLRLSSCQITTVQFLGQLPNLQYADLSHNMIFDLGDLPLSLGCAVGAGGDGQTSGGSDTLELQSLDLSWNTLLEEDSLCLPRLGRCLPKLEKLDLTGCPVVTSAGTLCDFPKIERLMTKVAHHFPRLSSFCGRPIPRTATLALEKPPVQDGAVDPILKNGAEKSFPAFGVSGISGLREELYSFGCDAAPPVSPASPDHSINRKSPKTSGRSRLRQGSSAAKQATPARTPSRPQAMPSGSSPTSLPLSAVTTATLTPSKGISGFPLSQNASSIPEGPCLQRAFAATIGPPSGTTAASTIGPPSGTNSASPSGLHAVTVTSRIATTAPSSSFDQFTNPRFGVDGIPGGDKEDSLASGHQGEERKPTATRTAGEPVADPSDGSRVTGTMPLSTSYGIEALGDSGTPIKGEGSLVLDNQSAKAAPEIEPPRSRGERDVDFPHFVAGLEANQSPAGPQRAKTCDSLIHNNSPKVLPIRVPQLSAKAVGGREDRGLVGPGTEDYDCGRNFTQARNTDTAVAPCRLRPPANQEFDSAEFKDTGNSNDGAASGREPVFPPPVTRISPMREQLTAWREQALRELPPIVSSSDYERTSATSRVPWLIGDRGGSGDSGDEKSGVSSGLTAGDPLTSGQFTRIPGTFRSGGGDHYVLQSGRNLGGFAANGSAATLPSARGTERSKDRGHEGGGKSFRRRLDGSKREQHIRTLESSEVNFFKTPDTPVLQAMANRLLSAGGSDRRSRLEEPTGHRDWEGSSSPHSPASCSTHVPSEGATATGVTSARYGSNSLFGTRAKSSQCHVTPSQKSLVEGDPDKLLRRWPADTPQQRPNSPTGTPIPCRGNAGSIDWWPSPALQGQFALNLASGDQTVSRLLPPQSQSFDGDDDLSSEVDAGTLKNIKLPDDPAIIRVPPRRILRDDRDDHHRLKSTTTTAGLPSCRADSDSPHAEVTTTGGSRPPTMPTGSAPVSMFGVKLGADNLRLAMCEDPTVRRQQQLETAVYAEIQQAARSNMIGAGSGDGGRDIGQEIHAYWNELASTLTWVLDSRRELETEQHAQQATLVLLRTQVIDLFTRFSKMRTAYFACLRRLTACRPELDVFSRYAMAIQQRSAVLLPWTIPKLLAGVPRDSVAGGKLAIIDPGPGWQNAPYLIQLVDTLLDADNPDSLPALLGAVSFADFVASPCLPALSTETVAELRRTSDTRGINSAFWTEQLSRWEAMDCATSASYPPKNLPGTPLGSVTPLTVASPNNGAEPAAVDVAPFQKLTSFITDREALAEDHRAVATLAAAEEGVLELLKNGEIAAPFSKRDSDSQQEANDIIPTAQVAGAASGISLVGSIMLSPLHLAAPRIEGGSEKALGTRARVGPAGGEISILPPTQLVELASRLHGSHRIAISKITHLFLCHWRTRLQLEDTQNLLENVRGRITEVSRALERILVECPMELDLTGPNIVMPNI